MTERNRDEGPQGGESFDELRLELRDIFFDAVIVAFFVVVIHRLDLYIHDLDPPGGPLFFAGTRFEFHVQWMVDIMHIANFGIFVVQLVRRRLFKERTKS